MSSESGSVTLIFYRIDTRFWNEPFLNLVAAAAQLSSFTHVEIAIGVLRKKKIRVMHMCLDRTKHATRVQAMHTKRLGR